ncbi:Cif family virulence factor [Ferruginibacter sp.]|nr:SnoaL-like domain-containing protein [Ferruginibacter sp.]
MKKSVIFLFFVYFTNPVFSQTISKNDKKEIKQILTDFMECLVKKDSTKFYNLFHNDLIVWVGVTKAKSFADEKKNDSFAVDNFSATFKEFYRMFYKIAIEEKFYNVQITEDGYIASVTFDYSFFQKNKKLNWGKESWGLIKKNGEWKIASVLFSIEYEAINPEPQKNNKR